MTAERVSLADDSLIAGYAENIQRYEFALLYSKGKRVLDAGCGSGYGSHFLAANGAQSVRAFDISEDAIKEARQHYRLGNLSYECHDIETLEDDLLLNEQFDVIVNFESVAHLKHPERMINGVSRLLPKKGVFIISTPNGEISALDEKGRPVYKFHHQVFAASDFKALMSPYFGLLSMYGQWLTHGGVLRQMRSKQLFEQLCEAYYNPMSRMGRIFKRLAGRKVVGPPMYTADADSFAGDYAIRPLGSSEVDSTPWPPTVLIAVCEK